MRRLFIFFSFLLLFAVSFAGRPKDTLSVSSLEFVPNYGQWQGDFSFRASLRGGAVFFDKQGYVVSMLDPEQLHSLHEYKYDGRSDADFSIRSSAYRVSFLDASDYSFSIDTLSLYPHYYNYFLSGTHFAQTTSLVPVCSSIITNEIYKGVSLRFYQFADNLKYEFIIAPYRDPSCIKILYDGVKSISVNANCLVIDNFLSQIIELQPFAYQLTDHNDTVVVDCHYVLRNNVVSFNLGNYDHSRDLIIDPVVVFSSFTGSSADNWGYTATYDAQGDLYGAGIAFGVGYPTTLGAFQSNFCNGSGNLLTDIAISKFDSTGSFLHYSTYLGGSYVDIPHSLIVNENDELFVFGTTGSPDFPVTQNAFDTSFNYGSSVSLSTSLSFPLGSDIFVSKFSSDGTQLLASSFVGGSSNDGINTAVGLRKNYADDNRGEILVDLNSNVYVVSSTYSPDFPVSSNSFDTVHSGGQEVCVFKLNQDLSQLIWSTFIGGTSNDAGYSMSLGANNDVYICGGTSSEDFPVSYNALQSTNSGGVEGFVAHLSSNGNQLLHSTYLGHSGYDQAYLIKTDRNFIPYVVGQTDASGTAWIDNASYFTLGGGQFLTKLSPDLDSVVWSTAFGTGNGGPDISPTALLVDYCSNIYISGWGSQSLNGFGGTAGMPVTNDAFQTLTDGSDYYFFCLSDDASQLVYASFFGGAASNAREHVDGGTSRFDRKGRIYQAVCAGCGGQSSFPTTPGAWSNVNGSSNCNLGVIKMDFRMPVVVADFHMPNSICAPDSVRFENFSQTIGNSTSYYWNFGDGTHSSSPNPVHYYEHSGYFPITLIVRDNGSCNFSDTLTKSLLVLANSVDTLATVKVCLGDFVQIGLPPSNDVTYHWSPLESLSSATLSNPNASPAHSTWYTLIASSGVCTDTLYQYVDVATLNATLTPDTAICLGNSVTLSVNTASDYNSVEWSTTPDFAAVFGYNQLSVQVSPFESTTYYVRVAGDVCTFIGSVSVDVSDIQVAALPELMICFEDGTELSVAHTGGPGCTYMWELGDGTTYSGEHPFVSPSSSTTYAVTITNPYGCSASATGNIVKRTGTFPTPFSAWCEVCDIVQASTTTVYSTDYGDGYIYQWSPIQDMQTPNAPSSDVSPMESTLYTISVTDTFGCVKTDTVQIVVHELTCDDPFIFVPNAFSPNADGKNDVLYVRSEILEEFYFAVYSRWGEKVFETKQLDQGWDGTFKEKPCQNGVYDYYFTGTCVGGKTCELKGNVMLIR